MTYCFVLNHDMAGWLQKLESESADFERPAAAKKIHHRSWFEK